MSFGGSSGTSKVKSDINVTPLVDVVLVLLIIFIVAIPIMMREITLDIPKKPDPDEIQIDVPGDQLIVELKGDGQVMLTAGFAGGEVIQRAELATKLQEKLDRMLEKDRIVFVDFEDSVLYGDAVSLMDTVKGAGAKTVGLKMKEETPQAPQ
jgi:biopolymer transport protein TolR